MGDISFRLERLIEVGKSCCLRVYLSLKSNVILSRNGVEAKNLGWGYATTPDSSVAEFILSNAEELLQNDMVMGKMSCNEPS